MLEGMSILIALTATRPAKAKRASDLNIFEWVEKVGEIVEVEFNLWFIYCLLSMICEVHRLYHRVPLGTAMIPFASSCQFSRQKA